MGIRGLMSGVGMDGYALISLVLFFASFVGIVVWTLRRPQKEMDVCSRLWEDEDENAPARTDLAGSDNER